MYDPLPVYNDVGAIGDTEYAPGARSGNCLNCNRSHAYHYGWACEPTYSDMKFYELMGSQRFFTLDMCKASGMTLRGKYAYLYTNDHALTIPAPSQKPEVNAKDISDWRAWAHNQAGDCACGIARNMCDYHRK